MQGAARSGQPFVWSVSTMIIITEFSQKKLKMICQLNKLSKAVFALLAFSLSFLFPAVSLRYWGSSENQSQKLARSLSATGSAFDSRQSPFAPAR
jgi:hypothetical protein